jgi:hypothetical protein
MTKPNHPEIGRELKVSDLHKGQIAWLQKEGRPSVVSAWVVSISPDFVGFYAGEIGMEFLARRTPDDGITDDSNIPMAMYSYLGKP